MKQTIIWVAAQALIRNEGEDEFRRVEICLNQHSGGYNDIVERLLEQALPEIHDEH